MTLIEFGLGFMSACLAIMFIGWFDVAIMRKPMIKMAQDSPKKTFMIVSAWELMFFAIGVFIGRFL
jgi:hypothetical protein